MSGSKFRAYLHISVIFLSHVQELSLVKLCSRLRRKMKLLIIIIIIITVYLQIHGKDKKEIKDVIPFQFIPLQ